MVGGVFVRGVLAREALVRAVLAGVLLAGAVLAGAVLAGAVLAAAGVVHDRTDGGATGAEAAMVASGRISCNVPPTSRRP
jgi:hypothetical protein